MATVRKRGDSYQIRVFCGLDITGKRIEKYTQWKPDPSMSSKQIEKELERRKVIFEQQIKHGRYYDGSISFQSFADSWMQNYGKTNLSHKTYARNIQYLGRINKAIGHIKLKDLKPYHLNMFYRNLEEPGVKMDVKGNSIKGAKLAPKTIVEHHRLISSILSFAVKWGLLEINVAKNADPPKKVQTDIDILDEYQLKQMLTLLDDEPIVFRTMIKLLIYTGMRRGELCGLEWKDINLDTGVLRIERSSQYIGNKTIITKEPKTKAGKRTLMLSASMCTSLKEYQLWQNEQKELLGDLWEEHDRLFTQAHGLRIYPDTVSQNFLKFIRKHNLKHVTLHSLRHTNASLLVAEGIDIRTVSQRLGHANTSTTLNMYTHALQSKDIDAANKLDAALSF